MPRNSPIGTSTVDLINSLEAQFEALSDEALGGKTAELQQRLAEGETLDELLPEAFAAVREASKRTIGQRHYDVQLIGGMALHEGRIAEMKTGEGKTLTGTLPLYLNALTGRDLATFEGHSKDINALSFVSGKRFLLSSAEDRRAKVWDIEKRTEIATLELSSKESRLTATRDGRLIVTSDGDKVTVWTTR